MNHDSTIKGIEAGEKYDGSGIRIAIVHARWNAAVIEPLVKGCVRKLVNDYGVKTKNIIIESVPGSWELPGHCQTLIRKGYGSYNAVIAIGVLIKGKTMHFEYISEQVSSALMNLSTETSTPVIYGVLNVLNDEQALLRAGVGEGGHNHGEDWAAAAVEMGIKTKVWIAGENPYSTPAEKYL
ncbi:lumazine synthase [Saitoella coloradoensis]